MLNRLLGDASRWPMGGRVLGLLRLLVVVLGIGMSAVSAEGLSQLPEVLEAVDASAPLGALTGALRTRVVAAPTRIDVIAMGRGPAGLAGLAGTVTVEWLDARDDRGPLAGDTGCRETWWSRGVAGRLTLAERGAGRQSLLATPMKVGPVWRLRLTALLTDGRLRVRCSGDAFAVRPDRFVIHAVSDRDSAHAGTERSLLKPAPQGGVVHRAGQPFALRAEALDATGAVAQGYEGAPSLRPTRCVVPTANCELGVLQFAARAVAGQIASDQVTYSEVGIVRARLEDHDFAAVDASDTPAAERRVLSPEVEIGRFMPDRFQVTLRGHPLLATQQGACATAGHGFTLLGQPFGWARVPEFEWVGLNAQGQPTRNWRAPAAASAAVEITPSLTAFAVDRAPLPLHAYWAQPSVTGVPDGRARVQLSGADRFLLPRDPARPVVAFEPQLQLAVSIRDASEASVVGNGVLVSAPAAPGAGDAAPVAFDAGGRFYFGRISLRQTRGDVRRGAELAIELQHFTDRGWLRLSAAGECVAVPATAWAYGAGSGAWAGGRECLAARSTPAVVALRAGLGRLQLPGVASGQPAALTLTLNVGGAPEGQGCQGHARQPVVPMHLPHWLGARAGQAGHALNPAVRLQWRSRPATLRALREVL